jgi:hypothetical protein
MTDPIKSGLISRRKAFSLMAAALGVAVPVSMLAVAEAEAQTAGMERRQERRTGRHERREARRTGRHERRETRRGGGEQPATSGTTGAAK